MRLLPLSIEKRHVGGQSNLYHREVGAALVNSPAYALEIRKVRAP